MRGKGTVSRAGESEEEWSRNHTVLTEPRQCPPSPSGWGVLLRPMREFAQRRPSGFSLTPAGTAPLEGKCSRGAGEQK